MSNRVAERWQKLRASIQKRLKIRDADVLDVCVATILSAQLKSDPVWLLVCGPSSSGKTEILRMFGDCKVVMQFTGMTENALISGYTKKDDDGKPVEYSLLSDLNRKALVIKDMSELLSMRDDKRDKIFAIFRDAFDGYVKRAFGGEAHHKSFQTRFSILGATTSAQEAVDDSKSKAFGQRFIHFNLQGISNPEEAELFFEHCLSVGGNTDDWRPKLKQRMVKFLEWAKGRIPAKLGCNRSKLFHLCQLAATARAPFIRDRYQGNAIVVAPQPEVGVRLGKQIYTLMCLVKWLGGNPYRIAKRVAQSCILPQARCDILRLIHLSGRPVKLKAIVDQMSVSASTVRRHLEELKHLGLITIKTHGSGDGRFQMFRTSNEWKPHMDVMFKIKKKQKPSKTYSSLAKAGLDLNLLDILKGDDDDRI